MKLPKQNIIGPHLDVMRIREDFPILKQRIYGLPLVYLDNSNTTQKPYNVIMAMNDYYCNDNANIYRSLYSLNERATTLYEETRDKVQKFINANHRHEIIFVKGTTEAINLVATCFGRSQLKSGDEIIVSEIEHHSNIVPWQLICEQMGATLKVIPVNERGELDLNAFAALLTSHTRLVAVNHVSHVLGTINPVKEIIGLAHQLGVPVLLDGAQAVPHMLIDVQDLDCDFYVFSGHKMYGPTGTGVLYGKVKWLEKMPPYQFGGNMIEYVAFAGTTYNELPYKFEAGTANIAGVIGLSATIDYLNQVGLDNIAAHECDLLSLAVERLSKVPGIRLIGTSENKVAVISFVLDNMLPHDIGKSLDTYGVAVRVGYNCAMPLLERYNLSGIVRASFGLYNTHEEVNIFVDSLLKITCRQPSALIAT